MPLKTVIITTSDNGVRRVFSTLSAACELHKWPYNKVRNSNFPLVYRGYKIERVPILRQKHVDEIRYSDE